MTYQIKFKPSGHQIEHQSKGTILAAGMRQGLNLAHNCMNGCCGECTAKLLSGDIEQMRNHDFRLTEQQKNEGVFLTCCYRPASDLLLEMHELHDATEIPYQKIAVKVAKLEQLQDEVMQLHLRASRSQVLEFLAGQRVKLCLPDGSCMELGIASCPCDGLNLRFHLRQSENDFFRRVFSQLGKGSKLQIQGPTGDFTLDEGSDRPLVFIAMETGFAQVQSIIDHAISIDPDRRIALYWLSAIERGHYLSNYCRAWRETLDNFCYESIDLAPVGEESLESAMALLLRQQEKIEGSDVYVIAQEAQLQKIRSLLLETGLPVEQLHTEIHLPSSPA